MADSIVPPLANPLLPKPRQFSCYRFGGKLVKIYVSYDPDFATAWFKLRMEDHLFTQYGVSAMTTPLYLPGTNSIAVVTNKEVFIFQFAGEDSELEGLNELYSTRDDVRFVVFGRKESVSRIFPTNPIGSLRTRSHYDEAKGVLVKFVQSMRNMYRREYGNTYRPEIVFEEMEGEEQVFGKVCQLLRLDERQFAMPPAVAEQPWHVLELSEEQIKYHAAKAWIGAKLGLFDKEGEKPMHPGPVGAPLPSLGGIIHVHSSK